MVGVNLPPVLILLGQARSRGMVGGKKRVGGNTGEGESEREEERERADGRRRRGRGGGEEGKI